MKINLNGQKRQGRTAVSNEAIKVIFKSSPGLKERTGDSVAFGSGR